MVRRRCAPAVDEPFVLYVHSSAIAGHSSGGQLHASSYGLSGGIVPTLDSSAALARVVLENVVAARAFFCVWLGTLEKCVIQVLGFRCRGSGHLFRAYQLGTNARL